MRIDPCLIWASALSLSIQRACSRSGRAIIQRNFAPKECQLYNEQCLPMKYDLGHRANCKPEHILEKSFSVASMVPSMARYLVWSMTLRPRCLNGLITSRLVARLSGSYTTISSWILTAFCTEQRLVPTPLSYVPSSLTVRWFLHALSLVFWSLDLSLVRARPFVPSWRAIETDIGTEARSTL